MNVPLLDLKAQYATIKDDVRKAIDEVCESQYFILGPTVQAFEQQVAEYSGVKAAVGISSGTDALLCSLMAAGVGPGDEVITSPFTFFATGGCIARTGATPVWVDICPKCFNIEPGRIESAITDKTKAIIPVDLFGQLAEMQRIMDIAREHKLLVIEDAAQSIGAVHRGRKAGQWADLTCFSFFPSKNLGGFGDGGMIVGDNEELVERCRIFRVHGSKPKYYHKWIGGNFRLDALQAAILSVKLPHLDAWSQARRDNAAAYDHMLADVEEVVTPVVYDHNTSIYNQYTLRVPRRDDLRTHLKDNGVGCEIYYPLPLHVQECFAYLGHKTGDCPEAEQAAAAVLSIPIYPELTDGQQRYVVDAIKAFYA